MKSDITIELCKGKKHGQWVLVVEDTIVFGPRDGFGYTVVHTWTEPRDRFMSTMEVLLEIGECAKDQPEAKE